MGPSSKSIAISTKEDWFAFNVLSQITRSCLPRRVIVWIGRNETQSWGRPLLWQNWSRTNVDLQIESELQISSIAHHAILIIRLEDTESQFETHLDYLGMSIEVRPEKVVSSALSEFNLSPYFCSGWIIIRDIMLDVLNPLLEIWTNGVNQSLTIPGRISSSSEFLFSSFGVRSWARPNRLPPSTHYGSN